MKTTKLTMNMTMTLTTMTMMMMTKWMSVIAGLMLFYCFAVDVSSDSHGQTATIIGAVLGTVAVLIIVGLVAEIVRLRYVLPMGGNISCTTWQNHLNTNYPLNLIAAVRAYLGGLGRSCPLGQQKLFFTIGIIEKLGLPLVCVLVASKH